MEFASFQERIQRQFDAYCKKVLRNTARDIFRSLKRQAEREISLSDLPEGSRNFIAMADEYFEEERRFEAWGYSVTIMSELLAQALRLLPERQREIVLRYYFLGMNDREISETSHAVRNTIHAVRNTISY